jgi:hypothetical protein
MSRTIRPTISQTAVTATFVPFAVLLSVALLAAEQTETLDHTRLMVSTWVSLGFATVALSLFVFPRSRAGQYELLTWTLSFAAYLVHFYYAFGVKYGFSIARTYAGQGAVIATSNFALTALWTFDVAASWLARSEPRWLVIERAAARLYVFAVFVMSAVIIFGGFVRVLGIAMIAAVASCIAVRVFAGLARRGHATPTSSVATDAVT